MSNVNVRSEAAHLYRDFWGWIDARNELCGFETYPHEHVMEWLTAKRESGDPVVLTEAYRQELQFRLQVLHYEEQWIPRLPKCKRCAYENCLRHPSDPDYDWGRLDLMERLFFQKWK